MALTQELEALCAELEKIDPAAAKEQRALLEKHEKLQKPLQDSVLRQSEFSRKLNELNKDVEYGKTMKSWADKNVPEYERMKKEHDDAQAELAKLKAEIDKQTMAAAAASGSGGDKVDPALVAAAVFEKMKEGGFASKAEIAEEIEKVSKQFSGIKEDFFKTTFPSASKWQSELTNAQLQYHTETGKLLDTEAFSKFMLDNKIESPKAGLEKFLEPTRTEKKNQADAEARYNKLIEDRKKDNFPGSSGPASAPGHLQVRLAKKDAADKLFGQDVELGDGALAAMAAAELNTEGK